MLLNTVHPLLPGFAPVMRLAEQLPLPLVQAPEELLARTAHAKIARLILRRAASRPRDALPGVQRDLARPHGKRLPQHGRQLLLVKQVQHPRGQAVEVGRLVAQGHGARVGFEGLEHFLGERRRELDGGEGPPVFGALCGQREELG